MILHYFKYKENKDKKDANFVYLEIIKNVNLIIKKSNYKKKTEFNYLFEILCILLIAIFFGSKKKSNNNLSLFTDELMKLFINDLDHSLRLSGISDMRIGKYVKDYTKKFYYRIKFLDKIFHKKDPNLFIEYLHNFDILDNDYDKSKINEIYLDLNLLIKRTILVKNKQLLFLNLFK